MTYLKTLFILMLSFFAFSASISCNEQNIKTAQSDNDPAEECTIGFDEHAKDNVLFKLNGEAITKNDLPTDVKTILYDNDYESYNKNLMVLKEYALRLHLAKKLNKLTDPKNPPKISELIHVTEPTNTEIKGFFKKHKDRLPPNTSLDQVKNQISQYLIDKKTAAIFKQKISEIETNGTFAAMITAPQAPKINLDIQNYPTKGNAKADISVIKISDYLCGHCQTAHPKLSKIFNKYKDKITLTQINYALRPTGLSGTYARGAYCALKQNPEYFWKFHDEAFKKTSVPHDHSVPGHKHDEHDGMSPQSIDRALSVAQKTGLDINKFEKCLSSKEALSNITNTNQILQAQGVNSTPVFIVNNVKLAKGIKELEEVIKNNL